MAILVHYGYGIMFIQYIPNVASCMKLVAHVDLASLNNISELSSAICEYESVYFSCDSVSILCRVSFKKTLHKWNCWN